MVCIFLMCLMNLIDLLASYGDFDGLDVFQDLTIQIFTCFEFCAAFARCQCISDG